MEVLPREQVERIARLARLELGEEAVARLAAEMASVLAHFEEIRRMGEAPGRDAPEALGGGGPGGGSGDPRSLRPDEVDPDPLRRPPSTLAPEWRDGHFVVPRLAGLGGPRAEDAGGDAGGAADPEGDA